MTSATFSLGFPVKGPGKVEFERFEEEHVFSDGQTGPSMYSTPFLTHLLERTGWSGQMHQVLHMPLMSASTQHAHGYAYSPLP